MGHLKNLAIYVQRGWRKKNRNRRRSLFRGSKSPERDFDNLTSYPAPRQLYESTLKIEPAAINIYRDIIKCLTCYRFFFNLFKTLKIIFLIVFCIVESGEGEGISTSAESATVTTVPEVNPSRLFHVQVHVPFSSCPRGKLFPSFSCMVHVPLIYVPLSEI